MSAPLSKAANRLTQKTIETLVRKGVVGRHHDGNGLLLQITKSGSVSWLYRYQRNGAAHMVGLGALRLYSLKEARKRRDEVEKQLRAGIDPLAARKGQVDKPRTFREVAEALQELREDSWGKVHRVQWRKSFERYVYPIIGNVPVADINADLIVKVLRPIWKTKATAQRLRARIARVLTHGEALQLRTGNNPARLTDHLESLLGDPPRPHNHKALSWQDLPRFLVELRKQEISAARALEITILTALRTSEVLGAQWTEIDLTRREWVIPAARMKMHKKIFDDHIVPLSSRVVEIFEELPRERDNPYVFLGSQPGGHLGSRAMFDLLSRLRPGVTVHGFRATFRTWCAVETNVQREVCEQALARVVGNETERVYLRDSLLNKRRSLMEAWAAYCENPEATGEVVQGPWASTS